MTILRAVLMCLVLAGLSACGETSKFQSYDGPEVTRVLLFKEERRLYLIGGTRVLDSYDVGLGFQPTGHKQVSGDGRTPEGHYLIDRRNPNSKYHLSIGVSYPDERDRETAKALGLSPGGDIFIHGQGPLYKNGFPDDWTAGCIAVTDKEIERIYAMVRDGTPISIFPTMKTTVPGARNTTEAAVAVARAMTPTF